MLAADALEALAGEVERLRNEKVAGGPTGLEREAQVGSVSSPAPATDPAPMCEWTDVGKRWDTGCGGWDTTLSSANGKIICSICKAPIKFTEAKE